MLSLCFLLNVFLSLDRKVLDFLPLDLSARRRGTRFLTALSEALVAFLQPSNCVMCARRRTQRRWGLPMQDATVLVPCCLLVIAPDSAAPCDPVLSSMSLARPACGEESVIFGVGTSWHTGRCHTLAFCFHRITITRAQSLARHPSEDPCTIQGGMPTEAAVLQPLHIMDEPLRAVLPVFVCVCIPCCCHVPICVCVPTWGLGRTVWLKEFTGWRAVRYHTLNLGCTLASILLAFLCVRYYLFAYVLTGYELARYEARDATVRNTESILVLQLH